MTAERLERLSANTAHARSLGLPYLAEATEPRGVLNIVGRGPSVAHHLQIVRDSDDFQASAFWRQGDVWAVGTAFAWCANEGINATFVCADQSPVFAEPRHSVPCKRAILSESCDPAVFHALRNADVKLFDSEENGAGTTSAGMALCAGLIAGYTEFRLWGCDGSYAENTHADENQEQKHLIRLRCNGQEFRTNPQMVMQSEELADVIREHPGMVKDCSGGLLGAMVASGGEWELLDYRNPPDAVREMMERGGIGGDVLSGTEIRPRPYTPYFDDMARAAE
jgi:hypothetical protein